MFITSSDQLPSRLAAPKPGKQNQADPTASEGASPLDSVEKSWYEKPLRTFRDLFVPSNYPHSVSKDYEATRKWQLARDVAGSISWGYAAGMAVSAATVPGLAAAGLTLFSYGLIKDRLSQVMGFVSSSFTPLASRNPRAWMLAGDMLDSAGVAALSGAALFPGAFVPLTIATGLLLTFAGTMRGAAGADIGPRQAVADNLGELNAKNGNQNLIASNLGLAIGSGLFAAASGTLGAAALPAIGAASVAFGVYATARMLKELDMNPVNEKAVKDIVAGLEHDGKVSGPAKDEIWSSLKDILKPDTIELGQEAGLLQRDPKRFDELKTLYSDRKYLLESVNGQPYVVLKQSSSGEDRFQAMLQAVHMQLLTKEPEYQNLQKTAGQDQADFWLVQHSLEKVPASVGPLLTQLKDSGWSVDMFRFKDTGVRVPDEVFAAKQPATPQVTTAQAA